MLLLPPPVQDLLGCIRAYRGSTNPRRNVAADANEGEETTPKARPRTL